MTDVVAFVVPFFEVYILRIWNAFYYLKIFHIWQLFVILRSRDIQANISDYMARHYFTKVNLTFRFI